MTGTDDYENDWSCNGSNGFYGYAINGSRSSDGFNSSDDFNQSNGSDWSSGSDQSNASSVSVK